MRRVLFFVICGLICHPASADTIQAEGSTIVIAPDAKFEPGDACTIPDLPPVSHDEGAISRNQAQRQKFIDCTRRHPASDPAVRQADLDHSLAAIGDDQLGIVDEIHQDTRGAINRLGLGSSRR